jgi:hypothetical protein
MLTTKPIHKKKEGIFKLKILGSKRDIFLKILIR